MAPVDTQADRDAAQLQPVVDNWEDIQAKRSSGKPGELAELKTKPSPEERAVAWKYFLVRNPEYNAELWEEQRALCTGGTRLLRDDKLMTRVFPAHNAEDPKVYAERKSRAFYFPYPGTIIANLVAGLGADPVRVTGQDAGQDETNLPQWYMDFFEDVSPKGGKRQSFRALLMEAMLEALITRRSWILVDLPEAPTDFTPESELEQERAGLLNPYMITVEPEYVIDWQTDKNGELDWALVCDSERRRDGLADTRDTVIKTFTWYNRDSWTQWQISYNEKEPPQPEAPVAFLAEGNHSFGKVPLVRLELPEGLHAMGQLESLAKEHFNKRCAVSWAEYKGLFALLYEFLAAEDPTYGPVSEAGSDPDRAVITVRGPGHIQERGDKDRAEYVGPDPGQFEQGRKSCDEIMREMFRVMFSMALSVDMGAAAIRRSGESKAQDKALTQVILKELGRILREVVQALMELLTVTRNDSIKSRVGGADHFDQVDVMSAVEEAVEFLNGVPQKSATLKRAYLYRLYKLVMGDELTEEDLATIREELESMISAEEMMIEDSIALEARERSGDEDEDEDADDEDREAAKEAAKAGKPIKGPMYSSKRKR